MTRLQVLTESRAPGRVGRAASPGPYRAVIDRRRRLARLGAAPAVTLIVLGLIGALPHWIPELALGLAFPAVFAQIGTTVATPIFTGGDPVVGGAPDAGLAPTIALIAALVLGFATRQGGAVRHAVAPAAAVLAIAAALIAVAALATPVESFVSLAASIGCVALAVGIGVVAMRGYARRGVHPFARRTPGLRRWRVRWLVAYIAVLPVPFMVGRALVGGAWRDRGAEIAESGSPAMFEPLLSLATPQSWALGVVVGLAVWSIVRLVPPRYELPDTPTYVSGIRQAGRAVGAPARALEASRATGRGLRSAAARRLAPTVVVGVIAVLCAVVLVPAAAGEAQATVDDTRARVPESAGEACPSFELPGSSPRLGLVPGDRCVGLEMYEGLAKTGAIELAVEFDRAAGSSTPEGDVIESSHVAGVYDPVLVIAGNSAAETGLDVVVGVSFVDGAVVWEFWCPAQEPFAIRLAGTGDDDLSAGRGTYPGEPESVIVGCAESVHRLDPRTGAVL